MAAREAVPGRVLALLALLVAALFAALGATGPWQRLESKQFDALSVATAPNGSSFPITIVGIDEPSFAQLKLQWPWPRGNLARLVDSLTAAGAMVIAFDLQLSEPDRSGPAEDAALAAAIRRNGNIVLASDLVYMESSHARQWIRVDPLDAFVKAGALRGFARIELDPDLIARRVPREGDAFWRRIGELVHRAHPEVQLDEPRPGAMIRYAGPILTYPYVSYYQALDPSLLPPDAFKDQVVIVGRYVQASPVAGAAQSDVFSTPFTGSTGWFTPGAEIHAHILETMLRGDAIYPLPARWNAVLLAAFVLAAAIAMRRWRPLVSGAVALALVIAVAAGDWLLFRRFSLWWSNAGAVSAAVACIYLAYGGIAYVLERHRRAQLRHAFALYVSPEVVDHVMQRPDRLALGGERRDVTMMFTDLAGFTEISEKLEPEQVARILNRHFTGATRIVKNRGGTVNRFIGDAVMAMWGAPLDDPEQAVHACRAAIEMQEDIARLRKDLAAEGLPPIRMRIGIHSCSAVVGNLGSADRFDYTAIGDGVNLAARLEGVNKAYGTPILVSEDTMARLGGAVRMRFVDEVIVKGKSLPVVIYTPCEDDEAIEASSRAAALYRDRQWAEAERAWRRVEELIPGDGVAAVHLERIAQWRRTPPDKAWRGVVELDKL